MKKEKWTEKKNNLKRLVHLTRAPTHETRIKKTKIPFENYYLTFYIYFAQHTKIQITHDNKKNVKYHTQWERKEKFHLIGAFYLRLSEFIAFSEVNVNSHVSYSCALKSLSHPIVSAPNRSEKLKLETCSTPFEKCLPYAMWSVINVTRTTFKVNIYGILCAGSVFCAEVCVIIYLSADFHFPDKNSLGIVRHCHNAVELRLNTKPKNTMNKLKGQISCFCQDNRCI